MLVARLTTSAKKIASAFSIGLLGPSIVVHSSNAEITKREWERAARELNLVLVVRQSETGFGGRNLQLVTAEVPHRLRVVYPRGSIDPSAVGRFGRPPGGAVFLVAMDNKAECAFLEYHFRLADNFHFSRGGKLPGLYGGSANSGGRIPTGFDGFTMRFAWTGKGDGAVYAYLPNSKDHGTTIGRGQWRYEKGKWHSLGLHVRLNTPGRHDGQIQVWFDGKMAHVEDDMLFRKTAALLLEGMVFSTFFGGNDLEDATPVDTHIDFKDLRIATVC